MSRYNAEDFCRAAGVSVERKLLQLMTMMDPGLFRGQLSASLSPSDNGNSVAGNDNERSWQPEFAPWTTGSLRRRRRRSSQPRPRGVDAENQRQGATHVHSCGDAVSRRARPWPVSQGWSKIFFFIQAPFCQTPSCIYRPRRLLTERWRWIGHNCPKRWSSNGRDAQEGSAGVVRQSPTLQNGDDEVHRPLWQTHLSGEKSQSGFGGKTVSPVATQLSGGIVEWQTGEVGGRGWRLGGGHAGGWRRRQR